MILILVRLRNLILFIFLAFSTIGQAQTKLTDIEPARIKQKSIFNFLKSQREKGIEYFEDLQPSVKPSTNTSLFGHNQHRFRIQQPLTLSWEAYLTAHPATIWQGRIVSCGLIYSPSMHRIIYPDDVYPGLETGQIFFIEMKIFCGLVKFPVCFMVTGIDSEKHEITFSYVETGASKGAQTISLTEDGKSGTRVLHSSIHQTENGLRDKTLYPIYHRKAIGEVHRNIRKLLE